ncbi:MAG: zinc ABC transporter substrate-binding protein [Candidatus Kapabacteria bacterium]|nr:zinc ABC transporter substrate-binding protein [Candidatus Kapabacteria bacterium]MDW8012401.1 zinc ABC transporter substrate-binding protein [Bacteroidota bacterium]
MDGRKRRRAVRRLGRSLWIAALLGFESAVLWGCSTERVESAEGVVVTTSILGDAVRAIVQADVPVRVLMGPGVDPHLYKPTLEDVQALQRAACVVAHGLRLEGKMEEVLQEVARRKPVVFAAELAPKDSLRRLAEGVYDPHLWLDVRLWREVVLRVADTLGKLFPERRQRWEQRALQYAQRLDTLDRWVRGQIERIPPQFRLLVTVHDAFSYFGRAYGLETLSLQGISTAAEFGLHDMVRVAEVVVRRRLPAVFTESALPARLMENVVAIARQQGWSVRIGGELFSDALGPSGSGAETYEGMVRKNVGTIVAGLLGAGL